MRINWRSRIKQLREFSLARGTTLPPTTICEVLDLNRSASFAP